MPGAGQLWQLIGAAPSPAGLELGFPTWHTILLCMTFAPLGLLSQLATRRAAGRRPGGAASG